MSHRIDLTPGLLSQSRDSHLHTSDISISAKTPKEQQQLTHIQDKTATIRAELTQKYSGATILDVDDRYLSEIICVPEPTENHADYSIAVAVIFRNHPHVHRVTHERYQVVKGKLTVYINGQTHVLAAGAGIDIEPGQIHWAEGDGVWIQCPAVPGWLPQDQIRVSAENPLYTLDTLTPVTWLNPKAEIRTSAIGGKGIFALTRIPAGEMIYVWGKNIYTNREGAIRGIQAGKDPIQWDEDLFSVEYPGADLGWFINHSCRPNTWLINAWSVATKRAIEIDEEITLDYAMFETDPNLAYDWRCECGAPDCRGQITGNDWQRKELQERYKGHFSPLLTKWIAQQ